MENPRVEVSVPTWLAVIAEQGRDAARTAIHDAPGGLIHLANAISDLEATSQGEPLEVRRALLRVAAVSMRLVDQFYPGDGLAL